MVMGVPFNVIEKINQPLWYKTQHLLHQTASSSFWANMYI